MPQLNGGEMKKTSSLFNLNLKLFFSLSIKTNFCIACLKRKTFFLHEGNRKLFNFHHHPTIEQTSKLNCNLKRSKRSL